MRGRAPSLGDQVEASLASKRRTCERLPLAPPPWGAMQGGCTGATGSPVLPPRPPHYHSTPACRSVLACNIRGGTFSKVLPRAMSLAVGGGGGGGGDVGLYHCVCNGCVLFTVI